MKVLVITGDKNFTTGHPRFDLQAEQVEKLISIYFGRGALFPKIPQEKIDVITVQDPFWRGLFALYVARRKRARFNVQIHTDLTAQSFIHRFIAKIVLRHTHSVRVVSEKLKIQVLSLGVKAPIHVLPIFVDLHKFRSIIRRPHHKPTILWLGRFEKEKNPLKAILILEEVRKEVKNVQLIMLGSGRMESEVKKRASNLPVQILGWKNPIIYFETADVVLCTSLHESWGASIVEALAVGIPVVAPDVGIAKEAGAIVGTRKELGEKVIEVLKNGSRGVLRLSMLDANAWAEAWKKTL